MTAIARQPNRWTIAAAAVVMQIALGAVYAWSVFLKPVMESYGASRAEAGATFTIVLATLGLTAAFGGRAESRFGPRAVATLGGLLYGLGVIGAGFAPTLALLWLFYGVVAGIGLGLGYIVPLAMLLRWFPDRKGFISGLAVAGFGAGALLTGPLAVALLGTVGLSRALVLLGAFFLVSTVGAAQFFHRAPDGASPAQLCIERGDRPEALRHTLREPVWWVLWIIMALNVTAGAAVLSIASPLAEEFAGIDASAATIAIIAISLANGAGRLFWGSISDRIGRPLAFAGIFVTQFIAFLILPHMTTLAGVSVCMAFIGLCYGGGFGTMPAFVADIFGTRSGTIYGALLTAWSAGAIAGPTLMGVLDYRSGLTLLCVTVGAAALLTPFAGRSMPCKADATA